MVVCLFNDKSLCIAPIVTQKKMLDRNQAKTFAKYNEMN